MLIDLTQTITNSICSYPGDRPTTLSQSHYLDPDSYNNHYLQIGMHTGTHIDIPQHFIDDNRSIDTWDLKCFVGTGTYLDCTTINAAGVIPFNPDHEKLVQKNSIVICHTGWSKFFGTTDYFLGYPVLAPEYCELFISKNIKMLCIDSPSPDNFPFPFHTALFKSDILIAENLCHVDKLATISAFEIIALPLKIQSAGSIARIIARATTSAVDV